MQSASRPRWQQMTALVSLGTGGAMTGFSLIPGSTAADLASPASAHIRLLAHQQAARPAAADEAPLRSAIVNVAHYYLRMAQSRSPGEMEALIWQRDSLDGADHGPSCAAFASLTLELGAEVVGQQSWVTGGSSYPWPMHSWVDARVDPNPASLGVTSILQDAHAHDRWHPLGDGYDPLPGDWVLFDGHVEVVTGYSGGILHTIGGDSLPNFSVNAHQYRDPLGAQGVVGFVNNGGLAAGTNTAARTHAHVTSAAKEGHHHHLPAGQASIPGVPAAEPSGHAAGRGAADADVPAVADPSASTGVSTPSDHRQHHAGREHSPGRSRAPRRATLEEADGADVPGTGVSGLVATLQAAKRGAASIPGLVTSAHRPSDGGSAPARSHYRRHQPPSATPPIPASQAQQAFIKAVAEGAMASQHKYGVPAAVTIAQAIDESGWGQSFLAARDHNLFGIKGSGPAGSDMQPTQEFVNGQAVSQIASFRVYHSIAQSIEDHGRLLATDGPYRQSMTLIHDPNAFASSLTGVYATDPGYGAKLISLMHRYDLYRYDSAAHAAPPHASRPSGMPRSTAPRTSAPTADIPGATAPAAKPSQRPAARTRPATSPARTPSAPTSPEQPSSPPTSPKQTFSPPTSPAPTSTMPVSPRSTPRAPGPPAPRSGAPTDTGAAGTTQPPARVRATAPPTPARAQASGNAAAHAGTPQIPDIPGAPMPTGPGSAAASGSASSHGVTQGHGTRFSPGRSTAARTPVTQARSAQRMSGPARHHARAITAHTTSLVTGRYQMPLPPSVKNDFTTIARGPLTQAEPLYRDIGGNAGIGWQLLAACDWMQCQAQPRLSPVHGEKLGAVNADGTVYRTKSAGLEQCAHDLIQLARAVYGIDLTGRGHLSVRELASAFAAFRWGALLKAHHTSAMEFPYSVAGLTTQQLNMRWPKVAERNAPDKPGGRFRMPFGAVPVMLSLNYPATA
jgi:flagellum-specific peptidoglycan hydrolase FlgJ